MPHMDQGLKVIFSLISFVLIATLGGCRTVEQVHVEAPQGADVVSKRVKFQDQELPLEIYFPAGAIREPIDLYFFNNDQGALTAGVDRNSKYVIQEVTGAEVRGERVLRIYLEINHQKLPTYDSPDRKLYQDADLFASAGRLYRESVYVKKVLLRPAGLCNAVLVSRDQILTASHCIGDQVDCDASEFLIWNGDTYESHTCKEVILSKLGADQTLVRLVSKVGKAFSPAQIERRELYFKPATITAVVSDQTIWESHLLGFKIQGKGRKEIQAGVVLGSAYSMVTGDAKELEKGIRNVESRGTNVRLTNYSLSCESQPGQSGSGVFNLEGKLIGLLVATDGRFTPLDPEIVSRIQ